MEIKVTNIIFKIIIIILIFQFMFIPVSNAGFWEDIKNSGEEFIKDGEEEGKKDPEQAVVDQNQIVHTVNIIYNALLTLGISISVIIGAVIGIKLMTGSIEEQAKTKELLMPYVVGCVITFGAFGIWKIMMGVLSNI